MCGPFGVGHGFSVSPSVVADGRSVRFSHAKVSHMAATLDMVKLMGLPVAALEGMKTVFDGDNLKLIEAALAVHTAKPGKAKKAAPPKEEEEATFIPEKAPKAKAAPAKPVAPPAPPKVYVQRVEVYRGRARIKGGICKEQIRNVIAQLQALESHPSILTYAECQVQFPWDKAANQPA